MIILPDYVVVRETRSNLDGLWFDRNVLPRSFSVTVVDYVTRSYATIDLVPTNRFEVRDDGAVAEVWEVRP